MNDTGVDSHTTIIPGRATGHYNFGEGIVQAQYLNTGFTSGAGGLYSTVVDLYKWDRALYTDKLVSKATLNKMFTPHIQDCGYGWFSRTEFDRKLIEHPGGLNGFLTMIKRFVDDDVVVISLFNYVSTFARGVNKSLTAMALGEPYEPLLVPGGVDLSQATLENLTGRYQLMDSVLEITYENGKLWLTDSEGIKSEAIAQSETRFFVREANAVLHFDLNDGAEPERMILLQSERVFPCRRL
jgi:CubicO group peptidase (beta-lactamase class C family)